MIFCETRTIGWAAVRNIWLRSLPASVADHIEFLTALFDWTFPVMSYFVGKYCRMPTTMAAQELIFALTRLLKCLGLGCA